MRRDLERLQDILEAIGQNHGLLAPCDWLEGGRHSRGFGAVFLKGGEPGAVAFPPGWKPDTMIRLDPDDTEFLGMQGKLMVCRHKPTGQVVTRRGRS